VDIYTWNGTLSSNGTTKCLTADTPSIGYLTTFPPEPSPTFPIYESDTITITDDTKGLYFSPFTTDVQLGDFIAFYTDVGPLDYCIYSGTIPVIPHWTAQFLTHTSTSYEGSGDTSTSASAPTISSPPPAPPSSPSANPPPQTVQPTSPPPTPPNSPSSNPPPQTIQPASPTTSISEPSLSTNDLLPGISSQQSTSGVSSSAVVTPTGLTNGFSSTNAPTPVLVTPSQIVTSSGSLVAPLNGVMRILAVMGLASLFVYNGVWMEF
jgi:hypothetical protein